MADISQEINDFKNAIYGEEVRGSMISLAEKLNTEVESNTTNVNQAVETANTASTAANQAVEDANTTLQAANQAVTTAAGSAEDAEESATAAANSATAAANSATAAAQSAADAAEAAEGLEGLNGQASSVKAEDTEGLVGTAGGQTNVQALIDYIADQVKNQLVSDSALTTKLAKYILKSQIINNLLATQAGNVLDAVQGKALSDMIGDTSQLPEGAENVVGAVAQLNSELENKMPATAKYFGRSVSFNGYSSLLAWAKDNQFAFNVFVSKQFDDLPISYGFVWAVGTGIYNTGIKVYCSPNNSNTLYVRTAESGDSWATEWETITPS